MVRLDMGYVKGGSVLLRILQGVVLGLVVFVACNDKGEDENKQGTEEGIYTFSMSGDDGLINNGKGKVELQLMKDGKAVTEIEEGIEVTLKIDCGTDKTAEIKGELGKDGKASIDVDLSDKDWEVSDWGACKISAAGEIDGKNVAAEEVELKTISKECQDPNGCSDADDIPLQFKIGEEIGQQSLGGKLSLQGCSNASLYTRNGNVVARDADGVIAADATTKSFPPIFVLGVPGDNCKLQHSEDGKTTATNWAAIVAAAASENKAAGYKVGIGMNIQSKKISVTLPSTNTPASAVYVSGDSGAAWTMQSSPNWNGTSFDPGVTSTAVHEERVLLKVGAAGTDANNSNDKTWWHVYGLSIGGNAMGGQFPIDVPQIRTDRHIKVSVADGGSCGLHLFHLAQEGAVKGVDNRPRRLPSDGKHIDIEIVGGADTFAALAINGGTASYTSGCKIGLNIDGITRVAISATNSTSRPDIDGITVAQGGTGNNKVKVTLPSWDDSQGTDGNARVKASRDGGDSWATYAGANVTWGGNHIFSMATYDVSWNSTAASNQALVWVEITPSRGSKARWWYYAEGQ